jgi:DNA-binding CsgD family transcriptional regulator
MLQPPALKILLRTSLITAGVVVLYQLANLFLVYHYFRYEYAMLIAVVIALGSGIFLTKKYATNKVEKDLGENPLDKLTAKELQILELIHNGKTNKEIAAVNFVELTTIKTHVNNLYTKLEVNDRKAASKIYAQYAFTIKSSFSPPPENG